MKKKAPFSSIINKKARYDFEVLDTVEAGMVLSGPETKSIRLGMANLNDCFVKIGEDSQAYVHNLLITKYKFADYDEFYDAKQTRKILLTRKEIETLRGKAEQRKISLVPLKIFQKHRRFKLVVGIVRGKKQFEKREKKKREDIERDIQRALRQKD